MQIVKRGERPEDRTWEVTCSNCRSVLLYKWEDTHFQEAGAPTHPGEPSFPPGYTYVVCPVCSKRVSAKREQEKADAARLAAHRRLILRALGI